MHGGNNVLFRSLAVTIVIFGFLIAGATQMIREIDRRSADAESQLVRDAVAQAVVTCYAAEGAYPESLEYLKSHYGLAYNEDEFFVSYDAFASNLMPDIQVTRKGAGA